jgi:hypothetical protein
MKTPIVDLNEAILRHHKRFIIASYGITEDQQYPYSPLIKTKPIGTVQPRSAFGYSEIIALKRL